ncbi:MAG: site-specific integrase [Actinobacteria bacterium]|nr:site-specific integrase [Actinomycetota bacterium]MCA1737750.1 site-specific integrase [Actinomycetota bacterium]
MARKRGNGEGGISRRKDGRWEARYYADTLEGCKRKTIYAKTRKEVAEKLAKVMTEQKALPALVPTNITVDEFFVQYEDAVKHTMKRRSFETYRDIARLHLLPAFGASKLKNLTREHVQRMYSQKCDAGLSAARVRRIHGVLSSALNLAVRWRLIDHNVCKEVSPPRVPLPEIRPFSQEEAKRFLAAAKGDRYHALYVLGVTSGARIGELGGLFWSDLDLPRRVMRIQRALITGRGGQTFEPPKTSNSRRSIGLAKCAVEALEHHRERQDAEGFPIEDDALVFTNMVGKPVNPSHLLCRSFKPILKRVGLPDTTFHAATRHTFCCLSLHQGVNAKSVSLAMGHSSVAFTLSRYASYIPNYGDTADGMDVALG